MSELTVRATGWMERANCRDAAAELFFPEVVGRPKADAAGLRAEHRQVTQAKSWCTGCPVLQECLEYAIVNKMDGIWGSTTAQERNRLKRKTPPTPCGTRSKYARGCRCQPCTTAATDYTNRKARERTARGR